MSAQPIVVSQPPAANSKAATSVTVTAPLDDNVPAEKDRMKLGEALDFDTVLVSPNGRYRLVLQKDGNLVLYKTLEGETKALWASDTVDNKNIVLARLEHDGRLYLVDMWYNSYGNKSKANVVKGRSAYGQSVTDAVSLELCVQDDGNMAIYSDGKMIWETKTTQPKDRVKPTGHTLQCGLNLVNGEQLTSQNGKHSLIFQDDGNFVLYKTVEGAKVAAWSTNTIALSSSVKCVKATLQMDGNLVLETSSAWKNWASESSGKDTALTVRDDGNVVIASGDRVIWSTETGERTEPDTLKFGEVCSPGEKVTSPNKKYYLVYQTDANLVLYGENNQVLWTASTNWIRNPGRMKISDDGKLTLTDNSKTIKWQTNSMYECQKGAAVLKVRDDGHVVILDETGRILWAPRMELLAPWTCTRLIPGYYTQRDQRIKSPNGKYYAEIAASDAFAVKHESGVTVWEFRHDSKVADKLLMQVDGNLVVKANDGSILWSTGTRDGGNAFWVEDDGNAKVTKGWELGVRCPALNGPTDRLTSRQYIRQDVDCLTSKNGKYTFRALMDQVPTESGEKIWQAMFCLDNVQEKTAKYYFLAYKYEKQRPGRLTLLDLGDIEFQGEYGSTVWWSSKPDKHTDRRDRDDGEEYDSRRPSRQRQAAGIESYELILQDDGNLVLNGLIDRQNLQGRADYRDEYRYSRDPYSGNPYSRERREMDEEDRNSGDPYSRNPYARASREMAERLRYLRDPESRDPYSQEGRETTKQDRYVRKATWGLGGMTSFPSQFWPARSGLRPDEKLLRGQQLTLPGDGTVLKAQDDGNVVLYDKNGTALWASNTRPEYGSAGNEWLHLEGRGNIRYVRDVDRELREETWTTRTIYKEKYTEILWSSETYKGLDRGVYLQLQPGKLVLWNGADELWESDKMRWQPGSPSMEKKTLDYSKTFIRSESIQR